MPARLFKALTFFTLLLSVVSARADFEQAVENYNAGDFSAAFSEFKKLSQDGDPRSIYNLANMYRKGEGVEADAEQAVRLYRAAAERGHALAQNALGVMYAMGKGVEPNDIEAYAWFTVSALQGNPEAKENADRARELLSNQRRASAELIARQYFENYVGRLEAPE
ncbi:tetratricopeptide repeat protein [Motiliproteus sp. SC1-56]|uniref:tetratricopeptide repeat protein n=1 Tax=Motiliproteus sp. SC1-56 TaxID=2799565 RepID=UPI001A8CCA54|nr:tetratricopeptide repeat protein [Motiliproteus sp. SC1-56]